MDLRLVRIWVLSAALTVGFVVEAMAQAPRLRKHTATTAQSMSLVAANRSVRGGEVSIEIIGNKVRISTNGVPSHEVGRFPNRGNPHSIRGRQKTYSATLNQTPGRSKALSRGGLMGVAINGVAFDPGAAEFWQGNRNSGWQYEALGGAVTLGLDANFAHVQPSGAYHYHGLPIGLMQELGWSASRPSPLIGYAADGFPIYAITSEQGGRVVKMTSSYKLKSGNRPGGSQPGGRYDGAFVQDYAFVPGSGTLDECNGATVKTADYPNGTYAYFLTETYPVIPRCLIARAVKANVGRRGWW